MGSRSSRIRQMPAKPKRSRAPMSDTHKAALAEGREQGRAVRRYLEALEAHKPRRGRKRTPESMEKRLAAIEERLPQADPLSRLQLVQERMDIQRQLEAADSTVDLQGLEDERSEEHTSELQSPDHLVCRLLLEKKKKKTIYTT